MRALAACVAVVLWASAASAGEPLTYDRGVISEDTTWRGVVEIKGQTVVKKGATLTVEPGTVIRFLWSDEENDGIGDGELNVEGRIVARGTKENMITFTSAKENPAMKNWTFVMISASKDSLIDYCIFEYAFSGIQVHYSTALISNSIFRHNYEGIRFSTTDVVIEHNDFIGNTDGIRYEARGSRTVIRKNRFLDNEHAFFAVQKCTPSVKIFENTFSNRDYDVKMGFNQKEDLDFSHNWWGTTDRAEIAGRFFDRSADESLGRVIFEPYLATPPEGSGIQ